MACPKRGKNKKKEKRSLLNFELLPLLVRRGSPNALWKISIYGQCIFDMQQSRQASELHFLPQDSGPITALQVKINLRCLKRLITPKDFNWASENKTNLSKFRTGGLFALRHEKKVSIFLFGRNPIWLAKLTTHVGGMCI